jgi:MATE family multidrug resistance protein
VNIFHSSETIDYKRILNLSWPIILANLTIPLIGATNIAVVGRMPSPIHIGAVALGATVLQCIDWSLSFLRRGTTGITAQAYGAGDTSAVFAALVRSLLIALVLGFLVTILQQPISWIAFQIIDGSPEVEKLAEEYFSIRIWASMATMSNYVLLGWFYGIQKPKIALVLRILMNILNIPLAIFLAINLKMGVAGVAWSAFFSHIFVFVMGLIVTIYISYTSLKKSDNSFDLGFLVPLKDLDKLFKVFKLNGDIFLRTALVFVAFSWFTASGARQGDMMLAVNSVLLNLFWFISYALDGFANSAEALAGQALGANNLKMFDTAVRKTLVMAIIFSLIIVLIYALSGSYLVGFMTTLPAVKLEASKFFPWLIVMPVAGVWCFLLDGIYTGVTETKIMRDMMIITFIIYSGFMLFLPGLLGNHGLWLALVLFMLVRGITLAIPFQKIRSSCFKLNHQLEY